MSYFEDLSGVDGNYGMFIFALFAILIGPYHIFYSGKDIFLQYYSPQKSETLAAISCVVFIYMILFMLIIVYFTEDIKHVFCRKRTDQTSDSHTVENAQAKKKD